MPKPYDLAGRRFSRLTVIEFIGRRQVGGQSKRFWRCRCDCGNETELPCGALTTGGTRSCGCLLHDAITVHGRCTDPVYKVWHSMLRRCNSPRDHSYSNYGGRGITVCERWENFSNFIADMGECPAGLTLERINVDGNYEPDNCKWATAREQANNRRNNTVLQLNGKAMTVAEWSRGKSLSKSAILYRIKAGWPIEAIINTPSARAKN